MPRSFPREDSPPQDPAQVINFFNNRQYDQAVEVFINAGIQRGLENFLKLYKPIRRSEANVEERSKFIPFDDDPLLLANLSYVYAKLLLMGKLTPDPLISDLSRGELAYRAFHLDITANVEAMHARSLFELGILLYSDGRREVISDSGEIAQEYFEKYIQINYAGSRFAIACFHLGEIYLQRNERVQAAKYFRSALLEETCPDEIRNGDLSLLEQLGDDPEVSYYLAIIHYYRNQVLDLKSLSLADFGNRLMKDALLLKHRGCHYEQRPEIKFEVFHQRYTGLLVYLLQSHLNLFAPGGGLPQELLSDLIQEVFLFIKNANKAEIGSLQAGLEDCTRGNEYQRLREQLGNYASCIMLLLKIDSVQADILDENQQLLLYEIVNGDVDAVGCSHSDTFDETRLLDIVYNPLLKNLRKILPLSVVDDFKEDLVAVCETIMPIRDYYCGSFWSQAQKRGVGNVLDPDIPAAGIGVPNP